jgi:hypothetical protein
LDDAASDTSVEARVLGTSAGVLLAASGCSLASGSQQATGSRTYHALGGLVMTSMTVIFAWVAFLARRPDSAWVPALAVPP